MVEGCPGLTFGASTSADVDGSPSSTSGSNAVRGGGAAGREAGVLELEPGLVRTAAPRPIFTGCGAVEVGEVLDDVPCEGLVGFLRLKEILPGADDMDGGAEKVRLSASGAEIKRVNAQ